MTGQVETEAARLRISSPSILALDLSLTRSGYCLDGSPGVITSRRRGWERIAEITGQVFRLATGVDLVVIEGYSYGSRGQSVYQIAELGGIVRFWLYQHELATVEVSPSTLKKFATGVGNCGKDAMLAAAIRRFHLGEGHDDNNEADAYLLWCAAREAYGDPVAKVPGVQATCIHRLTWPPLGRSDAA